MDDRPATVQRKAYAAPGGNGKQGTVESGSRSGAKDDFVDRKEAFLKEMLQERKEEEVKLADLECKLREFILEVVKPTITRNTKLQGVTDILQEELQSQRERLSKVTDDMNLVKERSDMVLTFQGQLNSFAEQSHALEEKLGDYRASMLSRVEKAEAAVEHSKSTCIRLGRSMDRVTQDMDGISKSIKGLTEAVELSGQKNREHVEIEIRRVDMSLQEVKDMHATFANEVWGPEDPQEIAPPSLRRLDMQMRKAKKDLTEAMADLAELRRLDGDMTEAKQKLVTIFVRLDDLTAKTSDLRKRIEKIALDSKSDNKRVSNLMAAFTANLMQDVRVGFSHEVKGLQDSQQEMQKFVRDTQAIVADLERNIVSTGKQVEASWRECRTDIDSLENRRKRDKQGLEDGISGVQGRVSAALEASEATLKGLEHISSVLSMSLQSERMSAALDSTDFADRKEMPFVGVHGLPDKRKTGSAARRGGLDPELLFRLAYQPQSVGFQGTSFERQQLLSLRERLVQTAQEVLTRGPQGASAKSRKIAAGDAESAAKTTAATDQAVVLSAELPSGRHSVPLVPRPGSQGQPNARGSPLLGGPLFGGGDAATRAGEPTSPAVRLGSSGKDDSSSGSSETPATRLPALALGAGLPRAIATASTSASTPRHTSMGQSAAAGAPLTAR